MKRFLSISVLAMTILSVSAQDFLSEQKNFPRVRQAIAEKGETVGENLSRCGLQSDSLNILIIAYKAEKRLDIYGKGTGTKNYERVASYDICRLSGGLGPKREQGDGQVPEGFYHVDRFNPSSNFHLSLGINYPNASDRIKCTASNPGGDIFIHGACVTVGCLPVTDDKIKEIYLYALYARNCGQRKIPVYIFPFEMTPENVRSRKRRHAADEELSAFWDNLRQGYDRFHREKKSLNFSIDQSGSYVFQ